MKIQLTDKYIMTSDDHNFIINQCWTGKEGKSKGKEMMKAIAFYPTLKRALEGFVEMKLRQSSAQDIQTLLGELRSLSEHLKGLFQPKP